METGASTVTIDMEDPIVGISAESVFLTLGGFVLVIVNLAWLALICGIVSSRFRDVPQIATALVQVAMFLTPVFYVLMRRLAGNRPLAHTMRELATMTASLMIVRPF